MLSGSTSSPFFLLFVAVLRDSVLLSPESSSSVLAALNAELFAMRARRPCSSRSSKSDTLHDKNMGFYEMQSVGHYINRWRHPRTHLVLLRARCVPLTVRRTMGPMPVSFLSPSFLSSPGLASSHTGRHSPS